MKRVGWRKIASEHSSNDGRDRSRRTIRYHELRYRLAFLDCGIKALLTPPVHSR